MNATNYIARLKLSNFIGAKIIELDNDETMNKEKGIFIPIELNGLFVSPRNQVFAWFFVNEKLHDTGDGYSHYMKLKTNKKHVEKLDKLGFATPYIGAMKTSTYFTSSQSKFTGNNGKEERVKNIVF